MSTVGCRPTVVPDQQDGTTDDGDDGYWKREKVLSKGVSGGSITIPIITTTKMAV